MNIKQFKKILSEEVESVLSEASITKRFQKAVEALQSIQLKQQELRKKFVAEKDPKKKETFKKSLISLHKKVEQAEKDFNKAVTSEPIDDLTEKSQGLWANIHAKRKRGEKPAKKGSKAHKKAVKAARSINKEGKTTSPYGEIIEKLDKGLKQAIKSGGVPTRYAKDYVKSLESIAKRNAKSFFKDYGKFTADDFEEDVVYNMQNESVSKKGINEDVFKSFLSDDPAFKLHMATNTDNRKSVKARKTDKTFDDGVPVLKYIARASKKDSPLPKGKFKIIEDNKHGWWYYQVGNTWYGIQQKDYGTPPFEY